MGKTGIGEAFDGGGIDTEEISPWASDSSSSLVVDSQSSGSANDRLLPVETELPIPRLDQPPSKRKAHHREPPVLSNMRKPGRRNDPRPAPSWLDHKKMAERTKLKIWTKEEIEAQKDKLLPQTKIDLSKKGKM